MHFEFTKQENRCIERRMERFHRIAREQTGKTNGLTQDELLAAAKADGRKSFPGMLPCGMTADQVVDEIQRTCVQYTGAEEAQILETCAFYLEMASGRISGLSRAMDPVAAAVCYNSQESFRDKDDGEPFCKPEKTGEVEAQPWLRRGKFLPEELAALCGKDPVTVRIWRSKGRGGAKLVPDKDGADNRSSGRLMFTPQAVSEFLRVNDDLRTQKLEEALRQMLPATPSERTRVHVRLGKTGSGKSSALEKALLRAAGVQTPVQKPSTEAARVRVSTGTEQILRVGIDPKELKGETSRALYKQFLQARLKESIEEQEFLKAELEKFRD